MYLIMVFDMASDKPEQQRICNTEIELRGYAHMFRREYSDKERYKIMYVPMVLMPY